jgi:hypothetical protein
MVIIKYGYKNTIPPADTRCLPGGGPEIIINGGGRLTNRPFYPP